MPALKLAALYLAVAAPAAIFSPALAFEPKVSVVTEGFPRPMVRGVTNLPDGTVFMIDLRRTATRYFAQSRATVMGGRFASERFSNGGGDLNPGVYSVLVTMPVARTQPEAVRQVVGTRGEKITGALVEKTPFGAVVRTLKDVHLGGKPDGIADAQARARADEAGRQAVARDCADIHSLVNAAARSGMVAGSEISGAEKQREIERCKAKVLGR